MTVISEIKTNGVNAIISRTHDKANGTILKLSSSMHYPSLTITCKSQAEEAFFKQMMEDAVKKRNFFNPSNQKPELAKNLDKIA
jgi:hypothetical protein